MKRTWYIYRSSQLRYGSLIGERTTVTSVWHQDTRKKHWTQVISIQNIHCEGGGGGSPFIQILCTVLWERKKTRKTNNQHNGLMFPSLWLNSGQVLLMTVTWPLFLQSIYFRKLAIEKFSLSFWNVNLLPMQFFLKYSWHTILFQLQCTTWFHIYTHIIITMIISLATIFHSIVIIILL